MEDLKTKVIIDTDIGDDIDDAIAIAFALKSPEIDILGITTVFAAAHKRAVQVKALLKAADREDIPVYAGSSNMLLKNVKEGDWLPCQYSEDMEELQYNTDMKAIEFMARTIKKYPGEVVLAPIGAMTNIALLLRVYPEVRDNIKEIVWMGGAFYYHFVTWNMTCDVDAGKVVLESGIPMTIVSRDVCMPCKFPEAQIQKMKAKGEPLTDFVYEMLTRWRKKYTVEEIKLPILFDSLALCAIFNKDYLKFKKEKVLVEDRGRYTRGLSFVVSAPYEKFPGFDWYPNGEDIPELDIAYDVDAEGFVEFHFERLMS